MIGPRVAQSGSVTITYCCPGISVIFHLTFAADWEAGRAAGEYRLSTRERTLAEIRHENLDDDDELLPHIHGPLNLDAVVEVK